MNCPAIPRETAEQFDFVGGPDIGLDASVALINYPYLVAYPAIRRVIVYLF